jgi:hypothetical protein
MAAPQKTVVGVFENTEQVEQAVRDLRDAGFQPEQIGFAMKDPSKRDSFERSAIKEVAPDADQKATETGAVIGGVLGGLLGVVVAGVFPGLGAAILGASLLASITGGAALGGLAGALVGMGLPKEEAEFYKTEFEAGRAILTVRAGERYSEALAILNSNGAYDASRQVSNASRE